MRQHILSDMTSRMCQFRDCLGFILFSPLHTDVLQRLGRSNEPTRGTSLNQGMSFLSQTLAAWQT